MPNLEMPSSLRDQLAKAYKEEHIICPRCRNGHTVRGNFMDMCDFCCIQCLQGAEDFVVMRMLTQDEADRLVKGIKESQNKWKRG
jgi:hypothetical protein